MEKFNDIIANEGPPEPYSNFYRHMGSSGLLKNVEEIFEVI